MPRLPRSTLPHLDETCFTQALDTLAGRDRNLAAARRRAGEPPLRRWPEGFATLLDIIIGQQVSTAAAASIKAKLRATLGKLEAEAVLAASDETLRGCGLSRQKLAYLRDLAGHVAAGELDVARLKRLEEEAAIAELTRVKGIGRWTAEIYLLFALGRPDIFPADDLALQAGMQMMRRLPERPTAKALRQLAERWQPWRGAAAHFLWHYYHFAARSGE